MTLVQTLDAIMRRLDRVERGTETSPYKGTSVIDFTTTTLPHHGDYGYQAADGEIQVNCNGTIRAITTAAL